MDTRAFTPHRTSHLSGYRDILSLSWPILVEMGAQTLIMNVNTFMVSRLGNAAVASVGNVGTIFGLGSTLLSIIGFGAAILIAQYHGAGDAVKTTALTVEAMRFNVILTLLLTVFAIAVPQIFLHAVNTPASIWNQTRHYLRFASLSLVFQTFHAVGAGVLRSLGKTRVVLALTFFVMLTTLAGNAIVVYDWFGLPQLGLTGLALSNLTGFFLGSLVTAWVIHRSLSVPIRFQQFVRQWQHTKQIVSVGIPSALELGSYQVTQFLIAAMISLLGALEISTRVYATAVESMSFLVGFGVAQGIGILVGHSVGQHNYVQARIVAIRGMRLGVLFMSVVAVPLFFFGQDVIALFTRDVHVIQWGGNVLKVVALAQPAKALNMVVGGALRGAGDNRWLMWVSGLFVWLSVVFAYSLGFLAHWGLYGIWIGMMLDEWVRAGLVLRRFLSNRWQGKSYVSRPNQGETVL